MSFKVTKGRKSRYKGQNRSDFDLNPSAAGARDLRLLQAATKMLQLDKMRFFDYF